MDGVTVSKDKIQTLLCWYGADAELAEALHEIDRRDLVAVSTVSEFFERFNTALPGHVILGSEPESDTLKLLKLIRQSGKGITVYVALKDNPDPEEVRLFLRKGARDVFWVSELATHLPEMIKAPEPEALPEMEPESIVCVNPNMVKVMDIAKRIAPTDSSVLVEGESGTGKELVAAMIHTQSLRKQKPFVKVNCGAIPEPLLESQLYGHEKGSFTGAVKQQKGLFEISDNGSIFLDEIGELGLEMQVKLLRFLQSHEFRRVGGSDVIKVNVRVIAATNRNLKEEVAAGRFRMDLYYRLNVITLHIPPLRERTEEIGLLVDHFVDKLSSEKNIPKRRFSPEAVARLRAMPWPGNVRELENAVERLLLLAADEWVTEKTVVDFLDVPMSEQGYAMVQSEGGATAMDWAAAPASTEGVDGEMVFPSLADMERAHIAHVLNSLAWNKMKTARVLGINVKTLYNKIKAYQLSSEESPAQGAGENGLFPG